MSASSVESSFIPPGYEIQMDPGDGYDNPGPKHIDIKNLEVSFSGCGFLGIYHVGVAAAFQHFQPECNFASLCGAAAGALAAAGLMAGIPLCK